MKIQPSFIPGASYVQLEIPEHLVMVLDRDLYVVNVPIAELRHLIWQLNTLVDIAAPLEYLPPTEDEP